MSPLSVLLAKAVALWLGILVLAVANGALREKVLVPAMGRARGLAASGVLLSIAVLGVAVATAPWYRVHSQGEAWLMGGVWLGLTLLFEFGFGHFGQHKAWRELLDAYRFKDGNLWPVVLMVILIAPRVATLFWMALITYALCAAGHCQIIEVPRP